MRILPVIAAIVILQILTACSCPEPKIEYPPYPAKVTGWKETVAESGFKIRAHLVLKKGEESDNGKIGVKVVDILPPERCAEPLSYHGQVRVVFEFYNVSDRQQKHREEILFAGNHAIKCPFPYDATLIGISNANVKDEWVEFWMS
jgi:hypothetical protein